MKTENTIASHIAKPITTVWLVEDNNAFRSVVERVLNDVPDFRCPQTFASAEEVLEAVQHEAPDVILLDVALPGMNGIEAIRQIKLRAPEARLVMLTVFDDQKKIYEAIGAGASGYLLKTSPEEEIVNAIRQVIDGGVPMHEKVARSVWDMLAERALPKQEYGITPREMEILEEVVQGSGNKEIADKLSMSIHTVDTHLRHIFRKLGVNSRAAAVAKALKERLV